jgi:DNA uptake protein ComE-like DNA-binding protein
MAAVALAEAQATRTVAESQIRLAEREAELERMRAEARRLAESTARLQSDADAARSSRDAILAERDALAERVVTLEADIMRLDAELRISLATWAEARAAMDELRAHAAAIEETSARGSAVRRMAESERDELKQRLDEAITRMGQLERDLAAAAEREAAARAEVERAGRVSSESYVVQTALVEELRRTVADLRDRIGAHQNRLAVLEESVRKETERAASLEVDRDRWRAMAAESDVVRIAEIDSLRASIEQFRDRIAAHQHRSAVLEESLRKETERAASLEAELGRKRQLLAETAAQSALARTVLERERDAASDMAENLSQRLSAAMSELGAVSRAAEVSREALERLRRQYAESAVIGAADADRLRVEYEAMRIRTAQLEEQTSLLEESYRSALAGLNAANNEVSRLRSLFLERKQDSYLQAIAGIERIERELVQTRAERDDLAAELTASRREIAETIRVVEESSEALRAARQERDAALAAASSSGGADPRLEEAEARLTRYEREIEALRAMLAEGTGVPILSVTPAVDTRPETFVPRETALVPAAARPIEAAPLRVRLDLNTASFDELAAVPEIGPTRARALIWYRENVRPILSDEDLKSVPGFNDERIRALQTALDN